MDVELDHPNDQRDLLIFHHDRTFIFLLFFLFFYEQTANKLEVEKRSRSFLVIGLGTKYVCISLGFGMQNAKNFQKQE